MFAPRSLTTSPCFMLVASRHTGLEAALPGDRGQLWGTGNRMVKMAVWGLSATLGAAVFAVAQTAMDWGPEVLLQLFWCAKHDDNNHLLPWWINSMHPREHKHRLEDPLSCRDRGGIQELSWCQTGCFCFTTIKKCYILVNLRICATSWTKS